MSCVQVWYDVLFTPPEGWEGALKVRGPDSDGQYALAGEEEPVPHGTVYSKEYTTRHGRGSGDIE